MAALYNRAAIIFNDSDKSLKKNEISGIKDPDRHQARNCVIFPHILINIGVKSELCQSNLPNNVLFW